MYFHALTHNFSFNFSNVDLFDKHPKIFDGGLWVSLHRGKEKPTKLKI